MAATVVGVSWPVQRFIIIMLTAHSFLLALISVQVVVGGEPELPYGELVSPAEQYKLPPLGYKYGDLEPFLDEATLRNHHSGHHRAYTNKMNAALKEWRQQEPTNQLARSSILDILRNIEKVPEKYRTTLRNQGGGYLNHAIYWAGMSPSDEERTPTDKILDDIEESFGSYDKFKEEFTQKAKSLFGSGYVWLCRKADNPDENLVLTTTANQDSPVSDGLLPVLVLDVWEHAYYLKHQFRRPDYIQDWWKVVDWNKVQSLDRWWRDQVTPERDEL